MFYWPNAFQMSLCIHYNHILLQNPSIFFYFILFTRLFDRQKSVELLLTDICKWHSLYFLIAADRS